MPRSNFRAPARRRGPSPALQKAQASLAQTRRALSAARRNSSGKGPVMMQSLIVSGGGVGAALLNVYFPYIGPIPTPVAAGALLVGAAAFMLKGKSAAYAAMLGAGMLAKGIGDFAEDKLLERAAASAEA